MTFLIGQKTFQGRRAGFTLVEMLVVVMIVGLIVAAVAPMVFNTLSSTRLTSAGETMAAQISLAKQMATSRNEGVEVRFYSYVDPETPGSSDQVRALALMRVSSTASVAASGAVMMEPLTPVFFLPSGIIADDSSTLSPMLSGNYLSKQTDSEKVIKRAVSAHYRAFRFAADGSPNLMSLTPDGDYQPNKSYLTLVEEKGGGSVGIPKNFYTLQIDPATGKTSSYRP